MTSDCATSDSEGELGGLFESHDSEDDDFYFESADIKEHSSSTQATSLLLRYSVAGVKLSSSVELPVLLCTTDECTRRLVAAVGMCVLPWFWMGFATKRIVLGAGVCVDDADLSFWRDFYRNVLAEFMFVHRLTFELALELSEASARQASSSRVVREVDRESHADTCNVLLLLGGGKDSIVAWHLLKQKNLNPSIVYVADNTDEFSSNANLRRVIELMGCQGTHIVKHNFHCEAFEKYARSYYKPCGHPWAALVLFDSLLIAKELKIQRIALGHEKSADEGNGVEYNGVEVNHQYDKSSAFLFAAQTFCRESLGLKFVFESAVSGMWELEIARIFCLDPALKPFHSCFQSCNEACLNRHSAGPPHGNEKLPEYLDRGWCCACEKCAFIYLVLSAWLPQSEVEAIFGGRNLFEHEFISDKYHRIAVDMRKVFASLLGSQKPFECIGTAEEAACAVGLAAEMCREDVAAGRRQSLPVILEELLAATEKISIRR